MDQLYMAHRDHVCIVSNCHQSQNNLFVHANEHDSNIYLKRHSDNIYVKTATQVRNILVNFV